MTAGIHDNEAFGIYIHWPFCAAKCPYCDFNSHVRHNPVDQAVFVEAYRREIAHAASLAPGRTATSIFFGGGTPSLMQPDTVAGILDAVSSHFTIAPDAEITMEANPSSVDAGRFRGYREAGVNRLSLGVQSLDDAQLRFLGRLHNSAEAIAAIETARAIFPRISFDMIYARPGQEPHAWRDELAKAIALGADHLSLYQLTIEPGTPFFDLQSRGRLKVPDSDHAAQLYELTLAMTEAAGLPAYEISNHARAGQECKHNLVYWRYQDYAGIGPGAHGRLTIDGAKWATSTIRNPETWWQTAMTAGHGINEITQLAREEEADEILLMGLRLAEGLDPARYERVSGVSFDPKRLGFLEESGLVERLGDGRLRATLSGFLVLDAIVADLAA